MLKRYILICSLLSSAAAFASKPLDSIGVENNNGKKLIIHKVDAKESYYSISRRYNVNVKDVQTYNNNIALQIGSIIKVPTEIPFNQKTTTSTPTITSNSFFDYTVVAKDNLNLIAERFATTVADIKKLNNLTSNNLQLGQVLRVPFNKTNPLATNNTTSPQTSNQPQETKTTPTTTGVTEHTVKPKEYLGVIAKQYDVTVEEIKELNGLSSNNLQIGQVLKIPAKGTPVQNETPVVANKPIENKPVESKPVESKPATVVNNAVSSKTEATFEHVVAANETIYSIAQKYQLTTYQLKTYNNLTSNDLTIGQKLIIKGEKPAPVVAANNDNTDEEPTEGTGTLKNPNLKRPAATYGLNRIEEKGTGVWITDTDLDPNKMLILHRTAPVGTIIQITNPMTNRSTFAKVVGKFTENETTKDVIIVMTKAVADAVGALDKRFFCTLTYGPKENEN
ncbi:LysM peptidoglycan-binding domain-containing protein [Pedobacter sp.]|uniref:LysM peptidoglycan-binding domain-containing protein n=1 Tax=Pedobacter sp. TaxID=1411316 RepID=UPI0031D6F4E6